MLPRDSRLIRLTLGTFFILATAYALYEARGILSGPSITVDREVYVTYEEFTRISGKAERIVELRLNGGKIPVTESGEFDEPYFLAEGTNYLILEARDARGRTTEKSLEILYISPALDAALEEIAPSLDATTSEAIPSTNF